MTPTPDAWMQRTLTQPTDLRAQVAARTSRADYWDWLHHVTPAGGCTHPIRLAGGIDHVRVRPDGTWAYTSSSTASMPDGVIYKPCGNRRAEVCPACARVYQRDAYQVLRTGLVGGKGVPEQRATHPAMFVTFTAPGFGPVHTRHVRRHTCTNRRLCDCRPDPCHARRDATTCPHGLVLGCYARHDTTDARLGTPLCLDCYDHQHQAVWNNQAPELWRRTTLAMTRHLRATAKRRGINPAAVKLSFGKVAEMQRRGVVHYHAIIRLDGTHPDDQSITTPPPTVLGIDDLDDAVRFATTTTFTSPAHPVHPTGWPMAWGEQFDLRVINNGDQGDITDSMVAGYLAKYATKSTEATGHVSRRLTPNTITIYANPNGTHPERLIHASWRLGGYDHRYTLATQTERPYIGLRRWAHMLGFGGHFLTKSRTYSVTFRLLREARVTWRRAQTTGPADDGHDQADDDTLHVVTTLRYQGAGWHTTGDALLAATAADMARRRRDAAREATTHALAA